MPKTRDPRFDLPLYSISEAATYLGVPPSTFRSWVKGYVVRPTGRPPVTGAPVLTVLKSDSGPSVPFVALAEGMVLAATRRTGVPMQRIRPALLALQKELGLDHALASKRLFSDGAEVLFDFATANPNSAAAASTKELVAVRNGQRVFTPIVSDYLTRIEHGADGYASLIHLPGYQARQVVADPTRSFGQPIFVSGGARVADVIDRFQAGETLNDLVADFGVPLNDLEDALRAASRRAA